MKNLIPIIVLLSLLFMACKDEKSKTDSITTPWGDTLDTSGKITGDTSKTFSVSDLVENGELIMLTENGPQTYYEYHGCHLGVQYLMVEAFAEKIGVRVRVELCKDSADMVRRLENNEGDIVAFDTPGKFKASNAELQKLIKKWNTLSLLNQISNKERQIVASGGVKRKIYSPFRDPEGGVISEYDRFFKQYARQTGWDWRLIAAQCYQESTFDPQAVSFAGAKGLMQIMPKTAEHLGLAPDEVYDPEKSIAAACRYLVELSNSFRDISDNYERQNFVLASYNGGAGHIRDAMALAQADGKNPHSWGDVKEYVLLLSTPAGYRNPIVKHGYIRGSETVGYVDKIRRRYATYGGENNASGRPYSQPNPAEASIREYNPTATPQRAGANNTKATTD